MTQVTPKLMKKVSFTRPANPMNELVEMTAAARSFDNIEAMNTAKQLMMRTVELQIGTMTDLNVGGIRTLNLRRSGGTWASRLDRNAFCAYMTARTKPAGSDGEAFLPS